MRRPDPYVPLTPMFLFYTRGECSASGTTKAFIKAIIDGKDNDGILIDVNAVENVNDYHSF